MDAHRRLARHNGIANELIFHKLSDLDNIGGSGSAMRAPASSLLANAETRVVYRQESDQLGSTAIGFHRGLVIGTRTDPSLPLATESSRGAHREIPATDFYFTGDEVLQPQRGYGR